MIKILEFMMAATATVAKWAGVPVDFEMDQHPHHPGRLRMTLSIAAPDPAWEHFSDCAIYNAPAYEPRACDCVVGRAKAKEA